MDEHPLFIGIYCLNTQVRWTVLYLAVPEVNWALKEAAETCRSCGLPLLTHMVLVISIRFHTRHPRSTTLNWQPCTSDGPCDVKWWFQLEQTVPNVRKKSNPYNGTLGLFTERQRLKWLKHGLCNTSYNMMHGSLRKSFFCHFSMYRWVGFIAQ